MHEQPQIEIPANRSPTAGPFSFALLVPRGCRNRAWQDFICGPAGIPSRGGAQEVHPPFGPEGTRVCLEDRD